MDHEVRLLVGRDSVEPSWPVYRIACLTNRSHSFLMSTLSSPSIFRRIGLAAFVLLVTCVTVHAADSTSWAGVYFDKKRLNGQAYFQLGIQQSGNAIQITFNTGYHDGHGVAPEAQGSAKPAGKDTLEFKFQDSFKNSGSGTIRRAGNDIIVDFIFANAVDKRCLVFYERNMHLKRVAKN